MSKSMIGILVLVATLWLIPEQPEHNHEDHPVPFAGGVKDFTITTCGDTATVRSDAEHFPIETHASQLLGTDRPE